MTDHTMTASPPVERWRDIAGYRGHYEVSLKGRTRGVEHRARTENQWGEASRTVRAHIMRLQRRSDGRVHVQLCREGIRERHDVVITPVSDLGS